MKPAPTDSLDKEASGARRRISSSVGAGAEGSAGARRAGVRELLAGADSRAGAGGVLAGMVAPGGSAGFQLACLVCESQRVSNRDVWSAAAPAAAALTGEGLVVSAADLARKPGGSFAPALQRSRRYGRGGWQRGDDASERRQLEAGATVAHVVQESALRGVLCRRQAIALQGLTDARNT